MENTDWLRSESFLKQQLTKAITRSENYFGETVPPTSTTDLIDRRLAMTLVGHAIIRYSILRLDLPVSNRSAESQRESTSMLKRIVSKNIHQTIRGNEITKDIIDGRAVGDIAFDRLISLMQLLGLPQKTEIVNHLLPLCGWMEEQVEQFRHDLPIDGKRESLPKNSAFDFNTNTKPNVPPKRPIKKLGRRTK